MLWKTICTIHSAKNKIGHIKTSLQNIKLSTGFNRVKTYKYPAFAMSMAFMLVALSLVPAVSGMNLLADGKSYESGQLTVVYNDGTVTHTENGEPLNAAVLHFHVEHRGVVESAYVTLPNGEKIEWKGHGGENIGEANRKAEWHWVLTPSGILTISDVSLGGEVSAEELEGPFCPIEPREGRTIIDLGNNRVRADKGEDRAQAGPFSVNLEAGKYDVTMVAYDGHTNRSGQSQPEESWKLLLRAENNIITETIATKDIPDGVTEATTVTTQKNLEVPQNIDNVLVMHAAYPASNPNSVDAVCASFDLKKESKADEPKLEIEKNVNKKHVEPGEKVEYTIKLTNTGEASVVELGVKDELPSILSADVETDWFIGELKPGKTWDVTYQAKVSKDASAGKYTNTATAYAKNHPPVSDSAHIKVQDLKQPEPQNPRLEIEKTANKDVLKAGEEIKYTIRITNTGDGSAVNLHVVDTLPNHFTASKELSWHIDELKPGETWEHSFTAQVKEDATEGEYKNIVTAEAENHDKIKDSHTVTVEGIEEIPPMGVNGITYIAMTMWATAAGLMAYGVRTLIGIRRADAFAIEIA